MTEFKILYSIESALLKRTMKFCRWRQLVCCACENLKAAADLLPRLNHYVGRSGSALICLTGLFLCWLLACPHSTCGVTQGCFLGPSLFLYMLTVGPVRSMQTLSFLLACCCANDLQFIQLLRSGASDAPRLLFDCVPDLNQQMSENRRPLNKDKTVYCVCNHAHVQCGLKVQTSCQESCRDVRQRAEVQQTHWPCGLNELFIFAALSKGRTFPQLSGPWEKKI